MEGIKVEPPSSNVIDFDALVRAEREKSNLPVRELKACKVGDVYNGMQRKPGEGSRMMLLDVRPHEQWSSCRIRDAESITLTNDLEVHVVADGTSTPFTCRGDVIAVLVDQSSQKESGGSETQRKVAHHLEATGAKKVFFLDRGFEQFHATYPFLCVGTAVPEASAQQATASWPAEIIPGKLYLGTVGHASNEHQLQALGVRRIVDLAEGSTPAGGKCEEHIEEHSDGTRTITLVPVGPDDGVHRIYLPTKNMGEVRIPMLEGLAAIAEAGDGAVLVVCKDGVSLGPALAVAHVMATCRIAHMQALTYVIKRKRDAAPHAGAYVQLQELQTELGLR